MMAGGQKGGERKTEVIEDGDPEKPSSQGPRGVFPSRVDGCGFMVDGGFPACDRHD